MPYREAPPLCPHVQEKPPPLCPRGCPGIPQECPQVRPPYAPRIRPPSPRRHGRYIKVVATKCVGLFDLILGHNF